MITIGRPKGYTKDPIEVDLYVIKEDSNRQKIGILRPAHLKDIQENITGKEYNSIAELVNGFDFFNEDQKPIL